MSTSTVQNTTASAPAAAAPVAKPVESKKDNRLITPFDLHYTRTKDAYNAEVSGVFATMGKVASFALNAIFETVRNIFAGLYDVAISPLNFVHGLFQSEEPKTDEKKATQQPAQAQGQQPAQTPKPEVLPAPRSGWQKFKDGVSYYASGAASGVASGASKAWATVKAHPKTAIGVVVGTATLGAGYYFGAPSYIAAKLGYGAVAAPVTAETAAPVAAAAAAAV